MKLKCHNEPNSLFCYVRDYRGDVQLRKYAGKEWNPTHSLELYDFGGSKLLNDLIESENVFDFFPADSTASYTMTAGGSTSVHLSTTLGRDEYVRATAHESMHAAQYLHGQGGASIYNEVEAYAFANYISYNSWSDDKSFYEINPMSIYLENILKNAYSSIYSNLSDYNKINSDLFFPSIITSVLFFKSLSNENNNGLYDNNILFPNRNKLYLESMLRLYITK